MAAIAAFHKGARRPNAGAVVLCSVNSRACLRRGCAQCQAAFLKACFHVCVRRARALSLSFGWCGGGGGGGGGVLRMVDCACMLSISSGGCRSGRLLLHAARRRRRRRRNRQCNQQHSPRGARTRAHTNTASLQRTRRHVPYITPHTADNVTPRCLPSLFHVCGICI